MTERQGHQLVPSRMEINPIYAIAEAIMGLELRRVPIGEPRQLLGRLVACVGAKLGSFGRNPRREFFGNCDQDAVIAERIPASGWLSLVQDLVRTRGGGERVHEQPEFSDATLEEGGSRGHVEASASSVGKWGAFKTARRVGSAQEAGFAADSAVLVQQKFTCAINIAAKPRAIARVLR
jgi:hypothetical protein